MDVVVPKLLNRVTVDKGAIPFVLSGANVMTPGLTSTGGDIEASLKAKTPVVGGLLNVILLILVVIGDYGRG